ncbi:MAG TPA: NAD(P)/FAD-dependent oxidoreductase [Bryobacteraceae bacterium]|nr:NAD(P)/FAD-dependent oxidoreductase [Bryobacteraceae bacterium]
MDTCDVLIVGGGPAGSSCAWGLRNSGLDLVILDKQKFPRDKICGGWITPAVLSELQIDPAGYARDRLLQPITGFRTGTIGGRALETDYHATISYGIRRREFDDYLLRRSGARTIEGVALASLQRENAAWIVNGEIRARLIVGAGGHFCPVAKLTGAKRSGENAVVAQEIEFEMDERQQAACEVRAEIPELYFCADIKGYGWCFRKQNFLNIGLGRMDPHRLKDHVAAFVRFLRDTGRIAFDFSAALPGHAYLLYGVSERKPVDNGLLLIGDAAGLAYKQSGEGIRPAIESGLLAAQAIIAARGDYSRARLENYQTLLARRFGTSGDWASMAGQHLPSAWIGALGRSLLETRWFTRGVVIDRWFLHANQPAL